MTRSLAIALAGLLALTTPAHSEAVTLDPKAYYPEGLYWDQDSDTLYYAEMTRERIVRWRDGAAETFVETKSCGPTAVARIGERFFVACHLGGHILVTDAYGNTLERIFEDTTGRRLVDPNDLSSDGRGIYISDSGVFSPNAPATGALLYLEPGKPLRLLATGLRYANGVLFDPSGPRLLASEHLARRILAFPVVAPGQIERPSIFADVNALARFDDPHAGPDGLDLGPDGRIYAAIYGGGRVLAFSPEGEALGQFTQPEPYVTSVAVAGNGQRLFACGAIDNRVAPYIGPVLEMPLSAMEPVQP